MKLFFKSKNKSNEVEENWKNKNKKYLEAIQKFLDRASNIKDEELRNSMINNMLLCDEILTNLAIDMFGKSYKNGFRDGKKYKIKSSCKY